MWASVIYFYILRFPPIICLNCSRFFIDRKKKKNPQINVWRKRPLCCGHRKRTWPAKLKLIMIIWRSRILENRSCIFVMCVTQKKCMSLNFLFPQEAREQTNFYLPRYDCSSTLHYQVFLYKQGQSALRKEEKKSVCLPNYYDTCFNVYIL